jgi:hypothetical protein
MDCGGKRSATPLWIRPTSLVVMQALSPLRSASAVQKLSPFSCGCFYLQTRLNLVVTVQPHPPGSNQDNTQKRFWEWLAAAARLKNDLKPAAGRS